MAFNRSTLRRMCLIPLVLLVASCGADHHQTKAVEPMLSRSSTSLKDKMLELCKEANIRTEEPTLTDMPFLMATCLSPDSKSQDFDPERPISFSDVDSRSLQFSTISDQLTVNKKSLRMYLRSQTWLQKSSTMTLARLAKKLDSGTGVDASSMECGDFTRKAYFAIRGRPTIAEDFSSAALSGFLLNLKKFNNVVDICNPIDIKIQRIGRSFLISAYTTEAANVETTLLKRGKALIFLIPHANDVYMEVIINADLYSFGVDRLMFDSALPMVGTGISKIVKYLLES